MADVCRTSPKLRDTLASPGLPGFGVSRIFVAQ